MPVFARPFATFAVAAATEFCRIHGWRLSTVGLHAVGDAAFFTKLAAGNEGASLARYERAMQYLSDNWPPGAVWPAHPAKPFPRPAGVTNGEAQRQQEQAEGKRRSNRKTKARREENGRFSRV